MVGQFFIVMRTRHVGEHAGYRHRGGRAARGGVRKVDDIILFESRIGLALVAAQREILRARCSPSTRMVRFCADRCAFRVLHGIFANFTSGRLSILLCAYHELMATMLLEDSGISPALYCCERPRRNLYKTAQRPERSAGPIRGYSADVPRCCATPFWLY